MKSRFLSLTARLARHRRDKARAGHAHPGYTGYSASLKNPGCPRCQGQTTRVPRRLTDLILSMLRPVSRHQCTTAECGWQGNQRFRRRPVLIRGPC